MCNCEDCMEQTENRLALLDAMPERCRSVLADIMERAMAILWKEDGRDECLICRHEAISQAIDLQEQYHYDLWVNGMEDRDLLMDIWEELEGYLPEMSEEDRERWERLTGGHDDD